MFRTRSSASIERQLLRVSETRNTQVGGLAFADAAADAEQVREDHKEHWPYPTRKAKEPQPHLNLLWMWKGVRDARSRVDFLDGRREEIPLVEESNIGERAAGGLRGDRRGTTPRRRAREDGPRV